jgi:hypothetical protein
MTFSVRRQSPAAEKLAALALLPSLVQPYRLTDIWESYVGCEAIKAPRSSWAALMLMSIQFVQDGVRATNVPTAIARAR